MRNCQKVPSVVASEAPTRRMRKIAWCAASQTKATPWLSKSRPRGWPDEFPQASIWNLRGCQTLVLDDKSEFLGNFTCLDHENIWGYQWYNWEMMVDWWFYMGFYDLINGDFANIKIYQNSFWEIVLASFHLKPQKLMDVQVCTSDLDHPMGL